jgi:phage/plasmid-associated DNA primase
LRQYLVNIGSELKADEIGEADALKILSEGRPITARELGGKPFTMAGYTCKLVFCSNHLPRFKSATGAEARRMKLVHFTTKQAPDSKLQGKLAKEVEGIFARVMVPALREILRGRPCPEGGGTSRIALQKFAIVNDPVTMFLNAYCQFGPHLSVRKSELVNSWAAFVQEHHLSEKLIRGTAFFRRLYELRTNLDTSRPRQAGTRVQMIHGISLRPEAPRSEPSGYEKAVAAIEESPELDVVELNCVGGE